MSLLGASLGSFVAVVICRLPLEISLLKPSFCLSCHKKVRFYNNVPIISFMLLRGKCSYCQAKIGFRTWFLEVFFAFAAICLFISSGWSYSLGLYLTFLMVLISIAYIDLDTFFIPNILLACLILLGLTNFSLWGGVIGFSFLALLNLISTAIFRKTKKIAVDEWAMGFGDAWLMLGIGLMVGIPDVFFVIFVGAFLGSIYGLIKGSDRVPFGAFLCVACVLALSKPGILWHIL
jgi:leader peptidase (prepilin peptidase)/N-methyltransferase